MERKRRERERERERETERERERERECSIPHILLNVRYRTKIEKILTF